MQATAQFLQSMLSCLPQWSEQFLQASAQSFMTSGNKLEFRAHILMQRLQISAQSRQYLMQSLQPPFSLQLAMHFSQAFRHFKQRSMQSLSSIDSS